VLSKGATHKQWRLSVLELEIKNVELLLTDPQYSQLEANEVEYFEKYRDELHSQYIEECILIGWEEDE
jgi:hypothetical protein